MRQTPFPWDYRRRPVGPSAPKPTETLHVATFTTVSAPREAVVNTVVPLFTAAPPSPRCRQTSIEAVVTP